MAPYRDVLGAIALPRAALVLGTGDIESPIIPLLHNAIALPTPSFP